MFSLNLIYLTQFIINKTTGINVIKFCLYSEKQLSTNEFKYFKSFVIFNFSKLLKKKYTDRPYDDTKHDTNLL